MRSMPLVPAQTSLIGASPERLSGGASDKAGALGQLCEHWELLTQRLVDTSEREEQSRINHE